MAKKPTKQKPAVSEASGTAVTVGSSGTNGKRKSDLARRIEQAMAEAGAKAQQEGKSDDEIRAAKLAAREEIKKGG